MKTFDVIFNDELDSNSMGFKITKDEAIDYIQTWNGTDTDILKTTRVV